MLWYGKYAQEMLNSGQNLFINLHKNLSTASSDGFSQIASQTLPGSIQSANILTAVNLPKIHSVL